MTDAAEVLLGSPGSSRSHIHALTIVGVIMLVPTNELESTRKARLVNLVLEKLRTRVQDTYLVEACCAAIPAVAGDYDARVRREPLESFIASQGNMASLVLAAAPRRVPDGTLLHPQAVAVAGGVVSLLLAAGLAHAQDGQVQGAFCRALVSAEISSCLCI